MRNTGQGSVTPTRGKHITMQQIMETMCALQETVAASRMDQERIQIDLVALQARNAELRRTNEGLRRNLQQAGEHVVDERAPPTPPRAFPMPFSQTIMDAMILATFVGPKLAITGLEDPEAHLTTFHTQMMLSEGSDAVHCKLFMSTLTGTTLDWFVSLPDGHVMSFAQFSTLFREQYIVNRAPSPVSYDLFDVRQYRGESLKDFLNRFGAQVVRLHTKDEDMMVHAFRKRILPGPFSESLIRCRPKTFCEIIRRAVAHIVTEREVTEKRRSIAPVRPRGPSRPQTMRVHDVTKEKKAEGKQQPYEDWKAQTRARAREDAPPGTTSW